MKLKRFRCLDCDLQILQEDKPQRCFCCGSARIVREGWKQRYLRIKENQATEEMTR